MLCSSSRSLFPNINTEFNIKSINKTNIDIPKTEIAGGHLSYCILNLLLPCQGLFYFGYDVLTPYSIPYWWQWSVKPILFYLFPWLLLDTLNRPICILLFVSYEFTLFDFETAFVVLQIYFFYLHISFTLFDRFVLSKFY